MESQRSTVDLYNEITTIVKRLERTYNRVYPWMVAMELSEYRAEQTVRRYMVDMWQRGLLVRVGGDRARRGYITPSLMIRQQKQKTIMVPSQAKSSANPYHVMH